VTEGRSQKIEAALRLISSAVKGFDKKLWGMDV